MARAFYMKFKLGHEGALDRLGGLPTHLPAEFPRCPTTDAKMAFLAQFAVHPDRLPINGASFIQLFQCLDVDEGADPMPVVVVVPSNAKPNHDGVGTPQPLVSPYDVLWEERSDPDEIPTSPAFGAEVLKLYQPKAGGAMAFSSALEPGDKALIQLTEQPAGFNFGGLMVLIYATGHAEVQAALV